jgi:hypothetical protein
MFFCSYQRRAIFQILVTDELTRIIYDKIRKDYCVFMQMKNDSRFGWDEENQLPTAGDDVWKHYLKVFYLSSSLKLSSYLD